MPSKIQLDTITPATSGQDLKTSPNIVFDASPLTGSIKLPSGTNLERTSTLGEFRWNTDDNAVEWFTGTGYRQLALEGPYENISRSGLTLYMDAADRDCFGRSGTSITNLTKWSTFTGTIQNGLAFDFAEEAFSFDAVDDVISYSGELGTTARANNQNEGFAISLWFKADSGLNQGTGNGQKLLFSCSAGATAVLRLGVAPNGGIFYADGGQSAVLNNAVNYNDDTWHNVTINRAQGSTSSTNVNIYVDNNSIGGIGSLPSWNTINEIAVGALRVGANTGDNFGGLIATAIMYNREITPTEIAKLYTAFEYRYT